MKREDEDDLLELGLLLTVMGLTAVVLVLSLILVFARESEIASSVPATIFAVVAISGLLSALFIFARRLKRFVAYR